MPRVVEKGMMSEPLLDVERAEAAGPSDSPALFDLGPQAAWPELVAPARTAPRLLCANRAQLLLRPVDLDATLPLDHPARTLWAMVEHLDLAAFQESIRAREGEPGRPAIDTTILVTLWLYATSKGVGSAREIARLYTEHDAYRWICGGVAVS